MSAEQMVADAQTRASNQQRAIDEELRTIRATLRVILETQAQMYADIVVLSGAPLDDEGVQALRDEWKQDTAKLIEEILEGKNDTN